MISAKPATKPASTAIRRPSQQRSRDRQEAILKIATARIAAVGSDALKMSEVASLAGISIGSLYQYFPDKSAIIRTLAERYNAESRICIGEAFASVRDAETLRRAYLDLVDQYYTMVLEEPVMRDIWSGMQADKVLMAYELEESRLSGELLAQAMIRAHGPAIARRAATTAFLVWQLGEAAVRLAISLDRASGNAVIEAFKRMTLREILDP
jgi:AcrR family transcriptional regulator